MSQLMTARETAIYLNLSYSNFMDLKTKNPSEIPPFLRFGKKTDRWDKETVDKWIKERQQRSNP